MNERAIEKYLTLLRTSRTPHGDPTEVAQMCRYRFRMSHKNNRRGEPAEPHSRSDRIVLARGRWYVTTRERVDVGPFATKEEAEGAADHLGQALDGIDDPVVATALIREFVRRRDALPG